VPLAAVALLLTAACDPGQPLAPNEPSAPPALSTIELSSYFPPSEAAGGWRKTTDPVKILSQGIDAGKLAGLGSYLMSLPYESFNTGVSGYDASNKAAIVVKDGWIVGEYYNQTSAATAVYYLASNGKTFTLMLTGRLAQDYPLLGFGLNTKLYDQQWLPQGYPLTDTRKANITFDQVFRHISGIIPEVEDPIASGSVRPENNWNFAPFTVGKDPDYPVTAPLYFTPGNPSTYTKGSTYSSVAFNHFSLVFRNVSGLEASAYLRQGLLDPIGVGRMAYKLPSGMGDYVWATAGNGLASARDFARLGYLMLHEGDWAGTRLFAASWLRNFTTSSAYRNMRSNVDCRWGNKYPSDLYRTTGSGQNWVLVVPSLDLILAFNGRTPSSRATEIDTTSLKKLFAAVTERYVACDGTVFNDTPPPSNTPPVASFTQSCSGLSCTFTDTSTDPDGTIASWSWSFGDGASSTQRNPSHTYAAGGSYTVNLTVTDNGGASSTASRSVTVAPLNASPTASFTQSCTALTCGFTDGSTDTDGSVVGWSWTFGDGGTSTARNPSHTYAAGGTYTVALTVTDNLGATGSTSHQVTVTAPNSPPIAAFSSSCSGLSCTFTDASTDADGTVTTWSWAFGDGGTSTLRNPSHTYAAGGTYTVALTVTDNAGAEGSTSRSLTVYAIVLSATGRKVKGYEYVDLSWSGAAGPSVDVYRNGAKVANVANSGTYTDATGKRGAATFSYTVCEALTSTCSNTVTIRF